MNSNFFPLSGRNYREFLKAQVGLNEMQCSASGLGTKKWPMICLKSGLSLSLNYTVFCQGGETGKGRDNCIDVVGGLY